MNLEDNLLVPLDVLLRDVPVSGRLADSPVLVASWHPRWRARGSDSWWLSVCGRRKSDAAPPPGRALAECLCSGGSGLWEALNLPVLVADGHLIAAWLL